MDHTPSDVDMLDPAVQSLFAVSMDLHGVLTLIERNQDGQARQRVWSAVTQIDRAIAQIREAAVRLITAGHGAEQRVLEAVLRTAATLVRGAPLVETLRPLLHCCIDVLPVHAAAIVLSRPATVLAVEPDDSAVRELLRLHLAGPGPAATEVDLAAWPQLGAHAAGMDVGAIRAAPLRLRSDLLGALVLPGPGGCGLDARLDERLDKRIVQGLADLAAIAIMHEHAAAHREQFVTQLEVALSNQAVIEQAKGVLAERHHTRGPAAFQLMAERAERLGQPLLDVARSVLDGSADL